MAMFRVRDTFAYAVTALRRHFGAFLAPCLAYSLMASAAALPMDRLPPWQPGALTLAMFGFMALVLFLMLGLLRASLKAYDGQSVGWRDALDFSDGAWRYAGVVLLVAALASLGTWLFVLPGLLVLAWLGFALYAAADERLGGWSAVSRGWALTRGHRLKILVVLALSALPTLLVSLAGLPWPAETALMAVVEAPLLALYFHASAYMYRRLQGRSAPAA